MRRPLNSFHDSSLLTLNFFSTLRVPSLSTAPIPVVSLLRSMTGEIYPNKLLRKEWVGGWEPWSSGYRRRLIIRRLRVRIPAPDTRWTFLILIYCKICIVCLKRPKINKKEAEDGPFFLKKKNGVGFLWRILRRPLIIITRTLNKDKVFKKLDKEHFLKSTNIYLLRSVIA